MTEKKRSGKKVRDEGAQQESTLIPFDPHQLSRAHTQWQFGDWESLTQLQPQFQPETLQHHPERAQFALYAAAGHLQCGSKEMAEQLVNQAKEWGINKQQLIRILISGVHNSLARAYSINAQSQRAEQHYDNAIRIGAPSAAHDLVLSARIQMQKKNLESGKNNAHVNQLALQTPDAITHATRGIWQAIQQNELQTAAQMLQQQISLEKKSIRPSAAHFKILETEIELLNHELSLALQRQQLQAATLQENKADESWEAMLKRKSVSQLGQDLWVLKKTSYKRGGFFVEFGATDGVLLSNSYLLEKEFGWNGICAEPNPKFFTRLKKNRNCTVSDQFIGKETGKEIEFILADAYGGSREFADSDAHKEKRHAYAAGGHVMTCRSISLNDFLQQHQAPKNIDYVSIDTEGSEFDLLSSFPFDKWNIRLLTVEHNYMPQRELIRDLMTSNGYRCTECEWDDWYEKDSE